MCWDVTAPFERSTRSPAQMRSFAAKGLSSVLSERPERAQLLDEAMLIVSELVTNSVNARCDTGTLQLSWHRDQLRIGVWDDAAGHPTLQAAGNDDSHGRGLAITASLSTAWGVDTATSGKTVWAELAVPTTLTATLACDG